MSDINRRDTLKLASAVAALGAGLGAMLADRSASAQTPTITGRPDLKPDGLNQIKIDSAVQIKIDGYKQIKIEKGLVQVKMYSGAGQFLHAANVPEEVANLVSKGAMVQFKFYRPLVTADKVELATDAFAASTLTQIEAVEVTTVRRVLASGARFSYQCKGCGRCCHDKRITLSPYELARLARAAGISTREVLEHHTDEAGTVLRFDNARGCTFLDGGACRVHEGRPLACRLYPLGRIVAPSGESIVELEPHPQTDGVYGEDGDPAGWFEAQGAGPFIAAASRYHELLKRMAAVLSAREGGLADFDAALTTDSAIASDWLDVDAVVAEACAASGEPEPTDLDARIDIHIAAMTRWLDSL